MGGAILSKPLIQFSVNQRGCVPSLSFDLRPNYGADDTTLMVESEEELKSLLMKVKEESEKVGLKLNIKLA